MTKEDPKCRLITVNRHYYDYRPKKVTNLYNGRFVPQIQIKGDWLRKAGFDIGDKIRIEIRDGELVLSKSVSAFQLTPERC